MRRALLTPIVLTALLAGCGDDDSADTTSATVQTQVAAVKPESLVVVRESEYKLDPRDAFGGAKGLVKIKVINDGKLAHTLAVDGPNGRVDLDGSLEPGDSATIEVDLDKPGSYAMYCPIDGHRSKGMKGSISVGGDQPARGAEGQSTTETQTTPTQTQTQVETQTETKTVTTPTQTQTQTQTETETSTTPTATTGSETP